MEKVQCQGVEASLSQCPTRLSNPSADVPCHGGMHAVVRCVAGSQFAQNGRAPVPPAVAVSGHRAADLTRDLILKYQRRKGTQEYPSLTLNLLDVD